MSYTMFNAKDEVEAGTSVLDAALDADALFTPQVAPVALPNGTVPVNRNGEPEFSTVYREGANGEQYLLNAGVKPGYCAVGYKGIIETADAMFENACDSLHLIGNGEKLLFTQKIGEGTTGGETLGSYLMYTASLNSTWPTAVYGFAFRPSCSNQIPTGMVQLSQKRTRNHDFLLFHKASLVAKAADVFDNFIGSTAMLRSVELSEFSMRKLRDSVLPQLDDDASKRAVTMADKRIAGIDYFWQEEKERVGSNAWALYNAIQSYEFHTVTKDRVASQAEVVRDPARNQRFSEAVKVAALATV